MKHEHIKLDMDTLNGISHETVTVPAFNILQQTLLDFDTQLSRQHRTALIRMLVGYTQMAQGALEGRWAVGLPAGGGKTQSIIAWLTQIHRSRADHISAAVFCSKVEELCKIKRALVANGMPEDKIALLHSYAHDADKAQRGEDDYASEPAVFEDRQIVLATHNKVRGGRSEELYLKHQGAPRSITWWDESLISASARALSRVAISAELGWLKGHTEDKAGFERVTAYLEACKAIITEELNAQKEERRKPKAIYLPRLTEDDAATFPKQLRLNPDLAPLRELLGMEGRPLRAAPAGGGGLVWYELTVPRELQNVFVLDASYPIRELVQEDPTIKGLEEHDPAFSTDGIKSYATLEVHQMVRSGARYSMTKAFTARREDRRVVRAIVDVVERIPANEAVLFFTFKPRKGQVDFAKILRADLSARGIDQDATVDVGFLKGKKPRFVWLTFGQETALSEHSYCSNVIFAGILHRDRLELSGAIAGQRDDLWTELSDGDVTRVLNGEIDHVVYQGLSRGSCRRTHHGVAAPMRAWLFHSDPALAARQRAVLPGSKWPRWKSEEHETKTGAILADVLEYLQELPQEQLKVSTRNLKERLGYTKTPPMTWTDAIRDLPADAGWRLVERSLVRAS